MRPSLLLPSEEIGPLWACPSQNNRGGDGKWSELGGKGEALLLFLLLQLAAFNHTAAVGTVSQILRHEG